ncbi:RNA-directed DNA polymerase, eukaryota, Reverse transcriptase zinc-binding domain protein [Artemisia annua]|uniref:RNA-directed DNA polymerase, eukaryota, Reverse transcriptase zinc-binding domain protein n=1 Tax=Artemisia annua TaxID=35608 RepID=A0A2U1Q380_ARTAN|nr:RNA-directed DNA polymerase, eukaryota, Reverse transcriptase zinc-binding domain protein [Artemisia annua]
MASFEKGGLSVGSLSAFNHALLQKWRWRFVIDTTSLWVSLIKSIHGDQRGFNNNSRCYNKGAWAKIVDAIRHMNDMLIIPWETLVRKVGNGSSIKFWVDEWVDNQPLKDRFNRLFYLESNKNCMINERWVDGSWRWEWRRQIRGGRGQEQLQQLLDLLQNMHLSNDMDKFSWSLDPSDDFLLSSTRAHIDDNTLSSGILATRWSNYIPRKVNIFIWRLVLDKLPTRHNLSIRGLELESLICPICHRSVETTSHRFIGCMPPGSRGGRAKAGFTSSCKCLPSGEKVVVIKAANCFDATSLEIFSDMAAMDSSMEGGSRFGGMIRVNESTNS